MKKPIPQPVEMAKKRKFTHTYKQISTLVLKGKVTTITFMKGTKIIRQPINDSFLFNRKGRKKSSAEITSDLHAIKHDLEASDYKI